MVQLKWGLDMESIKIKNVELTTLKSLKIDVPKYIPQIPQSVYDERLKKLKDRMEKENLDCLVFYADREHYSNFRHYTGFDPRFEEGILVIHREGQNYILLGNECLNLYKESRIPVEPVLCQALSLPNQPMKQFESMEALFSRANVKEGARIGIVGWKLFTGTINSRSSFDVPAYIVAAIRNLSGETGSVENVTDILIHPEYGLRIINDVHTIAYLEYGAAHASHQLKEMLDQMEPGKSEIELASHLNSRGLVPSCHPLLTTGKNRFRGLISPTDNKVKMGDAFCSSMGLHGGLSCRAGYAAQSETDVENGITFIEKLAKPYYAAVASWYEKIGLDVSGAEIYDLINQIFPKEQYGWTLNPGHLIGTEEWLSSPIYPDSEITFKSGMLVQMDIIPDLPGFGNPNAEDGICIADEELRMELQNLYPDVWARMERRRGYMIEEIGIRLKPEILPMSNLAGEYRPFFLDRKSGFKISKQS